MARVLVIDDNEEFREVVKDLLVELGHEACLASSPEEGRELCEKSGADLILCDLVMPMDPEEMGEEADSVMVGVHAIHDFKQGFPEIPVIAMSGQMEGQPLRAIQNFGAVDSIAKPFGLSDLEKVLKRVLQPSDDARV